MGGRPWKSALGRLASLASLTIASSLYADDSQLPPVVSAGGEEATPIDSRYDSRLDVTDIPSVFDSDPSAIRPVSYAMKGSCDSCDAGPSCSTGCATCPTDNGCLPWWAHRSGGFGEVLYLTSGNSDLIHATEQTGIAAGSSPTGPIGISSIGENVGFRVGFSIARSNCSSIVGSFARWDGATTSVLNRTGTNVLNSNVIHPSTATVGAQSTQATARQSATFQLADVMLRRVYRSTDCSVINWNGGLRYGNMEQGLDARQTVATATGLTTVITDIDFNGFGIIGGLDGERQSAHSGLLVYGRAMGSLLAGDWIADYRHSNQTGGGVIANHYEDFRVTPVVDTELGIGWQKAGGGLRLTCGYLFSTWFNAVTTRDYIQSVRNSNLLNLDDNLTFSGLTSRVELRF